MKKFTNHIDHAVWISHVQNIEKNVAALEKITDSKLTRFDREDMGFVMYLSWEAGLRGGCADVAAHGFQSSAA
jgi:hypothetical protein